MVITILYKLTSNDLVFISNLMKWLINTSWFSEGSLEGTLPTGFVVSHTMTYLIIYVHLYSC